MISRYVFYLKTIIFDNQTVYIFFLLFFTIKIKIVLL